MCVSKTVKKSKCLYSRLYEQNMIHRYLCHFWASHKMCGFNYIGSLILTIKNMPAFDLYTRSNNCDVLFQPTTVEEAPSQAEPQPVCPVVVKDSELPTRLLGESETPPPPVSSALQPQAPQERSDPGQTGDCTFNSHFHMTFYRLQQHSSLQRGCIGDGCDMYYNNLKFSLAWA